ncbi:MAG TPA: hypothetical protein VLG50_02765 [Candidatus Saccharimonadales bacterium]|nr:hypothetical protein [Candidatus Saccharimonadales bacterium]
MKKFLLFYIILSFFSYSILIPAAAKGPSPAPKAPMPTPASAPKTATPQITKQEAPGKYTYSISIPAAIKIENTSTEPMTLTSVGIKYTTSDQTSSSKPKTISASKLSTSIPAKGTISFRPKLTLKTNNQTITATFVGVYELGIDSQIITLTKLWTGLDSDRIFITKGANGKPKIDTQAMKQSAKSLASASTKTLTPVITPKTETIKDVAATLAKKVKSAKKQPTKKTKALKKSKAAKASSKVLETPVKSTTVIA